MVILASWGIAILIAYLYVHFGTNDLSVLNDGFKIEMYRAAIALMILRGTLYLCKEYLW